jgi:hypothetical protein
MSPSGKRSLFTDKVCRLCATAGDKLLPIFDSSGSKVDLKIKECIPTLNVSKFIFYFIPNSFPSIRNPW